MLGIDFTTIMVKCYRLAPQTRLRRVRAGHHHILVVMGGHEDDAEGAAVAVEVVAAVGGAEDRGGVDQPRDVRLRQALDVARHGVPDDEVPILVRRV
jgi:hypothetical protein